MFESTLDKVFGKGEENVILFYTIQVINLVIKIDFQVSEIVLEVVIQVVLNVNIVVEKKDFYH